MEFRHPSIAEKQDIEKLWSYCFEPKGDPFFEFYFAECYERENTLIGKEIVDGKEETLAMVHLRPYDISVRGKTMEMAYIVGVATDPTARRSGVGREILIASLEELRRKGHSLNILMPSLAGFYQPYGWDLYCHQWLRRLPLEELRKLADRTLDYRLVDMDNEEKLAKSLIDLAKIYESYTKNTSGYAVRDEKHWRRLLKSISLEGLNIVIAYAENKPVGYMFYKLGEEEIMVPEIAYATRQGQKAMLGYLYNHRSQGSSIRWNEGLQDTSYVFYPNGKEGNEVFPFMMSRVVDVKKALEEVPKVLNKDFSIKIKIEDSLADWNNGVFAISNKNNIFEVIKDEDENNADINMSVGALGLMLFGKLNASELAFENRLNGAEKAIEILTKVYPKQATYINEWY